MGGVSSRGHTVVSGLKERAKEEDAETEDEVETEEAVDMLSKVMSSLPSSSAAAGLRKAPGPGPRSSSCIVDDKSVTIVAAETERA